MKRMYYIGYMLCLLLAGCVVGEKADGLLEQRLSDRTLLVYMGGDNDLADETDEKLSALTEAWVRFPVQFFNHHFVCHNFNYYI